MRVMKSMKNSAPKDRRPPRPIRKIHSEFIESLLEEGLPNYMISHAEKLEIKAEAFDKIRLARDVSTKYMGQNWIAQGAFPYKANDIINDYEGSVDKGI